MVFKSLLLAGVMATTALSAAVESQPKRCGDIPPSAEFRNAMQQMSVMESSLTTTASQAPIVINTYVHVLAKSKSEKDGYLSDATITAQMKVLNDNFKPSGISFTLKGSEKTINAQWASDKDQTAMKKKLRKGSYRDLNLYFEPELGYLGYCYYPTNASPGSEQFIIDGCTIKSSSTPGNGGRFGEGKTTTHEVGHWFGLAHTFDGGCEAPGDYVDDTPAQASSSSGCPKGRDSCPSDPGLDPIHNYMDYSDDACYEEFTAGQNTRMKNMFNQYRA